MHSVFILLYFIFNFCNTSTFFQATTHGNMSINSDLVFSGNLRVDNLNLHGQEYNGVNVTQLIGNLTKLRKLGGLSSNFDSLLNMSDSIERALAGL